MLWLLACPLFLLPVNLAMLTPFQEQVRFPALSWGNQFPNSEVLYLFSLFRTLIYPDTPNTLFHTQMSLRMSSLTMLSKIILTFYFLICLCFLWNPSSLSLPDTTLDAHLFIVCSHPIRMCFKWGWVYCLLCFHFLTPVPRIVSDA